MVNEVWLIIQYAWFIRTKYKINIYYSPLSRPKWHSGIDSNNPALSFALNPVSSIQRKGKPHLPDGGQRSQTIKTSAENSATGPIATDTYEYKESASIQVSLSFNKTV